MKIVKKYNKTLAQVLIRYQAYVGISLPLVFMNYSQVILQYNCYFFSLLDRVNIVIPKSITRSKITQNSKVFDFKLSPEDIVYIDTFDCNGRICSMLG